MKYKSSIRGPSWLNIGRIPHPANEGWWGLMLDRFPLQEKRWLYFLLTLLLFQLRKPWIILDGQSLLPSMLPVWRTNQVVWQKITETILVAVVGMVIMSQWNFRVMKIIFARIRECCLTPNKLSISCKTLDLEKVTPETSVALMYSFFIQKIGAGMIIPKLRLSKYQARVISLRRFFQERWVSMMIFSGYVDVAHSMGNDCSGRS